MKKTIAVITTLFFMIFSTAFAQTKIYTVQAGDTFWSIAIKKQIGISELLKANPQIKNPNLIYPGQKINIPNSNNLKALENEVIKLTNQERAKVGLPALKVNWQLCRVARFKSQDMVREKLFLHYSPTYGLPFRMMESFGLKFMAAGENIAYGQRSGQEVVRAWMNSPGHRANILSPSFTGIGVGVAKNSKGVLY
ncbi:SafA/ExsA family spore coat assembly protein [Caldicellulosiruptor naganoensis]|uniref:SafA/ExsA family spore coat assembly protein n=1 Tax=Caldicellulosiruptor naganoensis TaxID=29324 RepID=A0ABY7BEM6_9FIRM|nr:SafA/ExsA family spore coat assembly protein [Caldicellulosiruptor naganoensis]WAM31279.1 SafA/ExsA family spore coat assembly protein [Caldicellulosiruptor naganoensis]